MDAPTTNPTSKVITYRMNRLLPYWAVFQADVKQTVHSWIYRAWVVMTIAAAAGYLLYRYGAKQVAGMVQPATDLMSDLLRWALLGGSVTLVIVLSAGAICGERGTMADSVLSRGISRFQYFLGKWHARIVAILSTFFVLGFVTLIASFFLLHGENLSLVGGFMALVTVTAFLVVVVTCGVTVSAMVNSTLISIAIVWLVLYGGGFVMSLLPAPIPSPERALEHLPQMLRGHYDLETVSRLILGSLGASLVIAIIGMIHFSRRDV